MADIKELEAMRLLLDLLSDKWTVPILAALCAGGGKQRFNAIRREVPLVVDKIVRKAMQKDLDWRYETWDEFSHDLADAFCDQHPSNEAREVAGLAVLIGEGREEPPRVLLVAFLELVQPRWCQRIPRRGRGCRKLGRATWAVNQKLRSLLILGASGR